MATCNPPHFFHRFFRSHFPERDWEVSVHSVVYFVLGIFFFPVCGFVFVLFCYLFCFFHHRLCLLWLPLPQEPIKAVKHTVWHPTPIPLPLCPFPSPSISAAEHSPLNSQPLACVHLPPPSSCQMCPQLPLPFLSRTRLFSSLASGSAFASIFFRCESSFLRFPFDWAVTFSSWDQLDCESSDLIGVPEAFCALVSSCVTWAVDIPHLIELLLILSPNVVKFLGEHILIFFNVVQTPSLDVKGLLSWHLSRNLTFIECVSALKAWRLPEGPDYLFPSFYSQD